MMSKMSTMRRVLHDAVQRCHESLEFHLFVQVGAFDGRKFDPIYRTMKEFRWPGVLLEPVPHFCEMLRDNYKDRPECRIVQKALTTEDGWFDMTVVGPDAIGNVPDWMIGSSSLRSRNVVTGHRCNEESYDRLAPYLQTIRVEGISWDSLVCEESLDHVTLLQIDAEGHDYEVLKQVDLRSVGTRILQWEHHFLPEHEQTELFWKVLESGFDSVSSKDMNTLALRLSDL